MKNISKIAVSFVFALLVLVSGFVFSPTALAVFNPTLTLGSVTTTRGSTISVPINANNWDSGVSAMDLLVKYDPAVLRIDSITENPNLADPLFNPNYSSDLIYLSYLAPVDTNFDLDNGTIATLNFTVITNLEMTTPLSFKTTSPGLRSKLYDVYGTPIPTSFVSGAITVQGTVVGPVNSTTTEIFGDSGIFTITFLAPKVKSSSGVKQIITEDVISISTENIIEDIISDTIVSAENTEVVNSPVSLDVVVVESEVDETVKKEEVSIKQVKEDSTSQMIEE